MWGYGSNKILKILRALDNRFQDILNTSSMDIIEKISAIYEKLDPISTPPKCGYGSALFPIEPVKEYRLDIPEDLISFDSEYIVRYLKDSRLAVGSIDSSTFVSGAHILVNIILVNVGFWYYSYCKSEGSSDNLAEFFPFLGDGKNIHALVKDVEIEAAKIVASRLVGDKKFIFLDESLSMTYSLSWDAREREIVVDKVKSLLSIIDEHNAIPIGIFYTRACDIARAIESRIGKGKTQMISDRVIMNHILGKYGRSPLFYVHSRAVQDKIDLLAFYLKVGERNVIRIEFPRKYISYVDDIHFIVLAHSILGNGYPLALQRAHELAVIGRAERELIIEELARRLGLPATNYVYSKKMLSKRWPIV